MTTQEKSLRMRLKKSILVATTSLLAISLISAPTAQAETFAFSSGPLTNLNPANATINGGFTKFPAGKGLYIQQCIEPVAGARPTICSDTVQVWVSDSGAPGTVKSTSGIAIKPTPTITGRAGSADCTKVKCGLFFRVDHLAPQDFSEDKFLAISFAAGTAAPTLAADVVTVIADGKALTKNVPSNIYYRTPVKITATAQSGLIPVITSSTPDCTFNNGVLTALKGSGICAIDVKTAGNATVAATSSNYPFFVGLGEQAITIPALTVKVGKFIAIPTTTAFGEKVIYKNATRNCVAVNGKLLGLRKGSCSITAEAAGVANLWKPMKQTFAVTVN